MDITRIKSYKGRNGALLTCTVVLDNCIMLNNVNLYKGEKGYFLVFPSKQDVYKSISELNKDISIKYPTNSKDSEGTEKRYEEFYHPVTAVFYEELLKRVVSVFESKSGG